MTPQDRDKAVLRLMDGAIDTHIHIGPESRLTRKQDALQLAKTAKEYGMRAIMMKNREYGTAALATLVQGLVPDIGVFGSYTMDNEAGGLNPGAVLAWIKMGARYIWMPTATAANSKGKVLRSRKLDLPGEGITILENGKLKPVVREILKTVAEFDVTLGTGHLSPEEHFVLVEEAIKAGVKRVVLTHIHCDQLTEVILTNEQIIKLVKMGAMVECCYWACHNNIYNTDIKVMADAIKQIGPQNCVLATDFGQADNPVAPEGLKMFITAMMENGIPEKDIEVMVKKNPAKILKI